MKFNRAGMLLRDAPRNGDRAPTRQQAVVNLPEAAAILGLSAEQAADLLTAHSVPRIAGWARRDVLELAARRTRS